MFLYLSDQTVDETFAKQSFMTLTRKIFEVGGLQGGLAGLQPALGPPGRPAGKVQLGPSKQHS